MASLPPTEFFYEVSPEEAKKIYTSFLGLAKSNKNNQAADMISETIRLIESYQKKRPDRNFFYVLRKNGEAASIISIEKTSLDYTIIGLITNPNLQRAGHARELLLKITELALSKSIAEVAIRTCPRAGVFWNRMGFDTIENDPKNRNYEGNFFLRSADFHQILLEQLSKKTEAKNENANLSTLRPASTETTNNSSGFYQNPASKEASETPKNPEIKQESKPHQ